MLSNVFTCVFNPVQSFLLVVTSVVSFLQEFIEQFRVLLPKSSTASKEDISALLEKKLGLDPTTYQIGKTKVRRSTRVNACSDNTSVYHPILSSQVFLKELERQQLQDALHKDVMRKIIFLQRWFRARLQRTEFLDMRQAATLIQVSTMFVFSLFICGRSTMMP